MVSDCRRMRNRFNAADLIEMGLITVTGNIFGRAGLVCALIATVGSVQAETAYVTDKLQLGVHMQADTSDRAFAKLKSGDRVEMSEENRFYARVRIPDGRTGWVKKNYLVTDKPAFLRLTEVEQERDKALSKLESLTSSLSDREARVSEIEAQVASREAKAAAEAVELERLRDENADLAASLEAYAFSVPGKLFFAASAACLVIGILLSWWWFDYRSRLRHGGFRLN
jgi:SH3 domain protein